MADIPQEYITTDLDLDTEQLVPGEPPDQFCIKTERKDLKLMGYARARRQADAAVDSKVTQATRAATQAAASASAANTSKNQAQTAASTATQQAQVATGAANAVDQAGQYVQQAMTAANTANQASEQAARANATALENNQVALQAAQTTKTYRDEALAAKGALENKEVKMDIIGDESVDVHGRSRRIFQGWTYHYGGGNYRGGTGHLAPDKVIYNAGASRMHFRLPIKTGEYKMYHLHFKGHCYGANKVLDVQAVGYQYGARFHSHSEISPNMTATAYLSKDSYVYVRIDIPSTYYLTLVIDAMQVGNGPLFNVGDIVAVIDTADQVGEAA